MSKRIISSHTISLSEHLLDKEKQDVLRKNFLQINLSKVLDSIVIDTSRLTKGQLADLRLDLDFLKLHPETPSEYLCTRLNNLSPTSKEEQSIITEVKQIITHCTISRASGKFLINSDKRIIIALTKYYLIKKYNLNFVTSETASKNDALRMSGNQVWIFNHFNSGFDWPMRDTFLASILNAHTHGGIVIVSSNQKLEKILGDSLPGKSEEFPRYLRRAGQLFSSSNREKDERKNEEHERSRPTSPIYKHSQKSIIALHEITTKLGKKISFSVQTKLKKHFKDIIFKIHNNKQITIDPAHLSSEKLNDMIIDLNFFFHHPNLAIENLCCRFNNFKPNTKKQKMLLQKVIQISKSRKNRTALGAFLSGGTGIGKTHLSIALAKQLRHVGWETYFITPETSPHLSEIKMQENQAWIIDDLNSGYTSPIRDVFLACILNAHNQGGILVVTSNQLFDPILEESLAAQSGEIPRYSRRAKAIFSSCLNRNTKEEKGKLELQTYSHKRTHLINLQNITQILGEAITSPVRIKLKKHFSGIIFQPRSDKSIRINPKHLSNEKLNDLLIDLKFLYTHPNISTENICCRFNNYNAATTEQKKLLKIMTKIATSKPSPSVSAAFLSGQSGIGKTHLSIALAKQLTQAGWDTYFITPETSPKLSEIKMDEDQAWIFDDLNSGYECPMRDIFLNSILNADSNGGIIIVTSNHPYQKILENAAHTSLKEEEILVAAKKIFPPQGLLNDQSLFSLKDEEKGNRNQKEKGEGKEKNCCML